MLGYKVFYNGKKFIAEQTLSKVKLCHNGLTRWLDSLETAQEVADKLNKHLKKDVSEVYDDKDFIIHKCSCGELFMFFGEDKKWFFFRNLSFPNNCKSCRLKEKSY